MNEDEIKGATIEISKKHNNEKNNELNWFVAETHVSALAQLSPLKN